MGTSGDVEIVRFSHLDNALAGALLETKDKWPKRVRDKIEKEQYDLDKAPLKGRQIVFLILESFKTDSSILTTMGVMDIYAIQDAWMGDKAIAKFLAYHDSVYQNLDEGARKMIEFSPK